MNMKTGNPGSCRSLISLILIFLLSFSVMTTACGRKGDPFPIIPPEEPTLENVSGTAGGVRKKPLISQSAPPESAPEITNVVPLKPPSGLTAIFTGTAIVLSWAEVTGQDIKYYKIYRSSGDGYTSIGKTDIPVFTDRNIEPNTEYRYRMSVAGESESPLSKEIKVKTIIP
jgi:hypothetical protein